MAYTGFISDPDYTKKNENDAKLVFNSLEVDYNWCLDF